MCCVWQYKLGSDVPILGLRPRTARTEGFLGGPRPHKDRSSKTERPAVFFGPQIRQFLGVFWVNFWYFYYLWVKHLFWPHALFHLMIRDGGAVQVHEKIIDKNVMVSWVGQNYTLGIVFSIIYGP